MILRHIKRLGTWDYLKTVSEYLWCRVSVSYMTHIDQRGLEPKNLSICKAHIFGRGHMTASHCQRLFVNGIYM